MSDLIYRLRYPAQSWTRDGGSQLDKDETIIDLADAADEIERLRETLQFIVDGYPNPNISHLDFRVGAYQAALSVLDAPFSQSPAADVGGSRDAS